MWQVTLATAGFEKYRLERALAEIEHVVPWHKLCAVVAAPSSRMARNPEIHQTRKSQNVVSG